MNLGEKIKELREGKNISQKELAENIGVSDVMVSMYEQNKKKPSLSTMEKIAEYFSVTVDYLLGRENASDSESITAHKISVLARKADGLSDDDRDMVMKHFEDTIDIYLKAKGLKIGK